MFLDVFDDKMQSRGFAVFVTSFKINYDYLVKTKSSITINKRNTQIKNNDILLDRKTMQLYKITNIVDSIKLTVVSGIDVIDFPVFIEDSVIQSTDIETSIGNLINDYWVSNSDSQIDLSITIQYDSTTSGSLRFFNKEAISLRRILERAYRIYNILCEISFNGTDIIVKFNTINANEFKFNLDHAFVNQFKLDINSLRLNKLTMYSRNTSNNLVNQSYYLLTDNTVSTDSTSENRELPVVEEIRYVEFSNYNIDGARNILQGQIGNNEIDVLMNDNNPLDGLKIGDKVIIVYKGEEIRTTFTSIKDSNVKNQKWYKFGLGRNRLSDKLIINEVR